MGIVTLECPKCGSTASIGVPGGADVADVAAAAADLPDGPGKRRTVACEQGHEVHVRFVP
jgi:hypothetical protein